MIPNLGILTFGFFLLQRLKGPVCFIMDFDVAKEFLFQTDLLPSSLSVVIQGLFARAISECVFAFSQPKTTPKNKSLSVLMARARR